MLQKKTQQYQVCQHAVEESTQKGMLTSGKIILGEVRKTFTLRGLGQECEEGEKFSKGWEKLVSIKTQVSL